jgi:hypothetical protein
VEQFTVLWILFALIVVGNTAVLWALYLSKRRKSRMNFFIMQLAVAGQCQTLPSLPLASVLCPCKIGCGRETGDYLGKYSV